MVNSFNGIYRKLLVTSVVMAFSLSSCNLDSPKNLSGNLNMAKSDFSQSRNISGKVQFPKSPLQRGREEFKTKAVTTDIISQATVSLIFPSNYFDTNLRNDVIGSATTNENGVFNLSLEQSFTPRTGQVYILEATKRVNGSGSQSLSVRTFLKFNGTAFESITGSSILINTKTTALTIMASNNTIADVDTIGKLNIVNGETELNAVGNLSLSSIQNVVTLVEQALTKEYDPISAVLFKQGQFFLAQPGNPKLAFTGCVTNCTSNTPIPTISPTIPNLGGESVFTSFEGCVGESSNCPDDLNSAIARSANGSMIVVWQHRNTIDKTYDIYAQRYNSVGAKEGSPILVNVTTTGNQINPDVAMDSQGNFMVVWQKYQINDPHGLYLRKFDASGNAIVPFGNEGEYLVNSEVVGIQSNPSIAMDDDGKVLLCWENTSSPTNGSDIYYEVIDSLQSGSIPNAPLAQSPFGTLVNTTTTGDQRRPDVDISPDGNSFIVAWEGNGSGDTTGIFTKKFDLTNRVFNSSLGQFQDTYLASSENIVNTNPTGTQSNPAVSFRGSNNSAVITWQSNQTGNNDIYFRTVSALTTPEAVTLTLGTDTIVNTQTTGEQVRPDVKANVEGKFVISFEGFTDYYDPTGLYIKRFNSNGTPVEEQISMNYFKDGYQGNNKLAINNSLHAYLSWQSAMDKNFSYTSEGVTTDILVTPGIYLGTFLGQNSPETNVNFAPVDTIQNILSSGSSSFTNEPQTKKYTYSNMTYTTNRYAGDDQVWTNSTDNGLNYDYNDGEPYIILNTAGGNNYFGTWTTDSSGSSTTYSASNCSQTNDSCPIASVGFNGTNIEVFGRKGIGFGKVKIEVKDTTGTAVRTLNNVDLSATSTLEKQSLAKFSGLNYGLYDVVITPVKLEDTDTNTYSFNFQSAKILPESKIEYQFSGQNSIVYKAVKGPDMGIVKVSLDNGVEDTIDLYAPTLKSEYVKLYNKLSPASHTIRIRETHERNSNSGGYQITIDSFGKLPN